MGYENKLLFLSNLVCPEDLFMKKRIFIFAFFYFMMIPIFIYPITLVRVGYIDLDFIIQTYTKNYLDTEITLREDYISQLQGEYNENYFRLTEAEKSNIQIKLRDQRDVLSMLRYNLLFWDRTGEIRDDIILQIIQRDLIESIKKTSELEGFSMVLDNTGNFIYGSEDINLTDRVLFRLDEKLLDLQNNEPLAPLSLEMEENIDILSTGD